MVPSQTTVAIVGSGLIGRAWAITFARAGCKARLFDPDPAVPEQAVTFISTVADDLAANDLLLGSTPAETLSRLSCHAEIEDALDGADWVQECGPEVIAVKRETFARLDAIAAPETILASSSSALLPSAISEGLPGRSRCLVAHPINPPYLVPAVELVPAPWTTAEAMSRGEALLRAIGQTPLVMAREIDGFIMNRLQGALLEEAFRLVAGGYASPEDVDAGIAEGLALRWSFMGPFETIDLNAPGGVKDYVARYQGLYRGLFEGMKERVDWSGPVLDTVLKSRRDRLPEDRLAERQLWRDRRLMALSAHKKRADDDAGR
ncbi:3-hydroxyacyl-CoA dehydrogenase [Jiella avicenniae]|uniref:3-hydroxyacyl-CoA dehydrogenase n=1 Tax=Jiella avicenniae TaxID=2907202 RepID=A0A9X1NYR1_9HYPH|nr:3-hydroxyacyl-CoA dehydrogenase [Jiella avicenniae]MCE7027170.1 3-hydroxyacyl-CoA dehydrogenase [Jiella avicenniae]